MPEIKLKPCPFCGNTNPIIQRRYVAQSKSIYAVQCRKCYARMVFLDRKYKAIEAWNRRIEKESPLPVEYEADGYDDNGNLNYYTAYCPNCRNEYEVDYDYHDNYCRKCGQKLDWRGNDE